MTRTISQTDFDPTSWEAHLTETARRHRVPGIVAGVLRIDPSTGTEERFVASTGVTNVRTRVESTRDTLCQIGSITKVVTATMIMQLREEGKLDLDTPVVELLPELTLDSPHTDLLTVRHLLTHTSGLDGDVFTDTGRGDDCVEKYVASLATTGSLFAPDTGWSYCNSGFVLAGRIIEVLDGRSWDASLRARVSERLDLSNFLTLPEEVLAHRTQYGHTRDRGKQDWLPAPTAMITRAMGPAGLITTTADDLLDFGRAFLRGGRGAAGEALLSEDSVRLMTSPHVTLVPAADAMAPQWGLGWMLDEWEGHRVYWHGGTTIGNNAWFQVLPDDGLAFVVFCNGGVAARAASEVFGGFAQTFAGVRPTSSVAPSGPASELEFDRRLLGTYADAGTTLDVFEDDAGRVQVRVSNVLEPAAELPPAMTLLPAGGMNRFTAREDSLSPWMQITFAEVDGRECAYVGIRCLPRRVETDGAGTDAAASIAISRDRGVA